MPSANWQHWLSVLSVEFTARRCAPGQTRVRPQLTAPQHTITTTTHHNHDRRPATSDQRPTTTNNHQLPPTTTNSSQQQPNSQTATRSKQVCVAFVSSPQFSSCRTRQCRSKGAGATTQTVATARASDRRDGPGQE